MSGNESDVLTRLQRALETAGVGFVHTRHEATYTSAEAAAVRGTSQHSGAKALIVKAGDDFLMAVMPADLSLDSNGVRKRLKCKRLRFATKDEVADLTGLTPGSIPPFGSLFGLRTICDEALSDNEQINFNAGSHTDSFQMSYRDYIAYESPEMVKVAKAPE
jgi:Ala-tRNA(Pro) deacylase